jgi:hypothetical protein
MHHAFPGLVQAPDGVAELPQRGLPLGDEGCQAVDVVQRLRAVLAGFAEAGFADGGGIGQKLLNLDDVVAAVLEQANRLLGAGGIVGGDSSERCCSAR